jgi:acetyl-CoA carboxylase biotin carboxylase subunit
VYSGYEVPVHYDPLLSKLIAHGEDREAAIDRMRRAVAEYRILGVSTTLPFHARALRDAAFVAGDYDTSFAERLAAVAEPREGRRLDVAIAAAAIASLRAGRQARPGDLPSLPSSPWWRAGLAEGQRGRG